VLGALKVLSPGGEDLGEGGQFSDTPSTWAHVKKNSVKLRPGKKRDKNLFEIQPFRSHNLRSLWIPDSELRIPNSALK
jgi:hypothetical protein